MFDEMSQLDNMGQDPTEQPDDIMALIMRMKQQEAQKQALAQQPPPSVMEMLMRQKQQRDAEQAATQQQALQQPDIMNQIYKRVAQENPERQAQLQQWQTQMPEDIAKANRDGYYGKGKFGRVIEAIAAATGVRPKFEQDALARYQRQQEQLKGEDVQNTKLAQAEIGATQRAQAAMMKQQTDERKRADLAESNATKAILAEHKNVITEAKNRIDAINADKNLSFKEKQLAVVEAKNKMDADNQRLQRMASVFQGSGMGATVGRALTMASEMNAKDAEAVNKAMSPYLDLAGAEAASKAQGKTSTTSGVQYMQRQDGSVATLPKVSSTTRGGGDVTGIQRAIQNVRLAQGIGEPPVPGAVAADPTEQSAQPQIAAPAPARSAPSPALAPYVDRKAQPYKGPGYALPEEGLRRMDTFTAGSAPDSTIETWVKRKDNITEAIPAPGIPGRKVDPKIAAAGRNEMAEGQIGATKILDAYANGTLDKQQGFFRRVASHVNPTLFNRMYRSELMSGPLTQEQKDFEIGLDQILTSQRASYLQKISGAQVSEQEYKRLAAVYPMSTDSPDAFMQSALYHAMLKPALARLDATGVFEVTGNITKAADALASVTSDLTNNIVAELKRAQSLPPGARAQKVKSVLATITNTDGIVGDALRKSGIPIKDDWITMETPTHRIHVRVPHSIPVMDRINRKQSIGRQADEARQELRNKLKSSTSVGQDEED